MPQKNVTDLMGDDVILMDPSGVGFEEDVVRCPACQPEAELQGRRYRDRPEPDRATAELFYCLNEVKETEVVPIDAIEDSTTTTFRITTTFRAFAS